MRNWVIVEDRPWVMAGFINDIRQRAMEQGEDVVQPEVLYYVSGDTQEQRKATETYYKTKVDAFRSATGIRVRKINKTNFYSRMDAYYNEGYIIFMDLNLTGSSAMYFNERINVQYAREKKNNVEEENQIWFYTTGASLDANFLSNEFWGNVIDVYSFEEGEAKLDLENAWDLLSDEGQDVI